VIEVDEGVGRPQVLTQLVARHQVAWPFEQELQDVERLAA
jgi:hypothetical protein